MDFIGAGTQNSPIAVDDDSEDEVVYQLSSNTNTSRSAYRRNTPDLGVHRPFQTRPEDEVVYQGYKASSNASTWPADDRNVRGDTPEPNVYRHYPYEMRPGSSSGKSSTWSMDHNPYSRDNTSNPYITGNTPNPYAGRNTPNPYARVGMPNPYSRADTPNPYDGVDTSNPYAGGQTPNLYAGGNTPNPYAGGNTPNPYARGNTPNPYAGGNTPNPYARGNTPDLSDLYPDLPLATNKRKRMDSFTSQDMPAPRPRQRSHPSLVNRLSQPESKKARKRRRRAERQALEEARLQNINWLNNASPFAPSPVPPLLSWPPSHLHAPTPSSLIINPTGLRPYRGWEDATSYDHYEPPPPPKGSDWVSSMAMAADNPVGVKASDDQISHWSSPTTQTSLPPAQPPPPLPPPTPKHALPPKPPPAQQVPPIGMLPDLDPNSKHGIFHFTESTKEGGTDMTKRNFKKPYIPNPARTLVMEQLPKLNRNPEFINKWSRSACGAQPVHLFVDVPSGKALVEFATAELARKAWGSPKLGAANVGLKPHQLKGKPREDQIKAWWYRVDGVGAGAGVGEIEEGEIEDDVMTGDTTEVVVEQQQPQQPKKETKKEKRARLAKEREEKKKVKEGKQALQQTPPVLLDQESQLPLQNFSVPPVSAHSPALSASWTQPPPSFPLSGLAPPFQPAATQYYPSLPGPLYPNPTRSTRNHQQTASVSQPQAQVNGPNKTMTKTLNMNKTAYGASMYRGDHVQDDNESIASSGGRGRSTSPLPFTSAPAPSSAEERERQRPEESQGPGTMKSTADDLSDDYDEVDMDVDDESLTSPISSTSPPPPGSASGFSPSMTQMQQIQMQPSFMMHSSLPPRPMPAISAASATSIASSSKPGGQKPPPQPQSQPPSQPQLSTSAPTPFVPRNKNPPPPSPRYRDAPSHQQQHQQRPSQPNASSSGSNAPQQKPQPQQRMKYGQSQPQAQQQPRHPPPPMPAPVHQPQPQQHQHISSMPISSLAMTASRSSSSSSSVPSEPKAMRGIISAPSLAPPAASTLTASATPPPTEPSFTKKALLARQKELEEKIARSKMELAAATAGKGQSTTATPQSATPSAGGEGSQQSAQAAPVKPSMDLGEKQAMEDRLRKLVLQSRKPPVAPTGMASPSLESPSASASPVSTPAIPASMPKSVQGPPQEELKPKQASSTVSLSSHSFSLEDLAVSFITQTIETIKSRPLSPVQASLPLPLPVKQSSGQPTHRQQLQQQQSDVKLELAAKQWRLEQHIAESKTLMAKLSQARTKEEKDATLKVMREKSRLFEEESKAQIQADAASAASAPPSRTNSHSTMTKMTTTTHQFQVTRWPVSRHDAGVLILSDDDDADEEDGGEDF